MHTGAHRQDSGSWEVASRWSEEDLLLRILLTLLAARGLSWDGADHLVGVRIDRSRFRDEGRGFTHHGLHKGEHLLWAVRQAIIDGDIDVEQMDGIFPGADGGT